MAFTRVALAVVTALLVLPAMSLADQSKTSAILVDARVIDTFQLRSSETRFGALEFVGGLELSSSSGKLGGMSGIRFESNGRDFIGVMDTGNWFAGRIERNDDGRLAGLSDVIVEPMRDASGAPESRKWRVDAEGLALDGDRILVSFEREHRVDAYARADFPNGGPIETLDMLIPREELRHNAGLETVALAPVGSSLEGAAMVVAERSINDAGDIFAAVLDGPRKGIFFVKRDPPYDITDGVFLPGGDLVLLERRFNLSHGVGMRIRRISGDTIRPGATVDGEILLAAGFGYQIDNMEAIDVLEHESGDLSLILVSDDNHSILQRNLFLEFRLLDGA